MKIVFTSDIHASPQHLLSMVSVSEKEEADAIIIGGDMIPHHLPDTKQLGVLRAQEIYLRDVFIPVLRAFREKRDIPIYLDLGNDDFMDTRKILNAYDDRLFLMLHQRKHHLTGSVDIIGYMNVPPTPFGRKDWEKPDAAGQTFAPGNRISLDGYVSYDGVLKKTVIDLTSDDTIENDLDRLSGIIDKPFIFVSHAPPYDTSLDVLYDRTHVGSLAIRRFVEKWSGSGHLIASFHGHIHESPEKSGSILTKIGQTRCFNPGQMSRKFRYMILRLKDTQEPPTIQVLYAPDF